MGGDGGGMGPLGRPLRLTDGGRKATMRGGSPGLQPGEACDRRRAELAFRAGRWNTVGPAARPAHSTLALILLFSASLSDGVQSTLLRNRRFNFRWHTYNV